MNASHASSHPSPPFGQVRVTREDAVVTLTLSHPGKLNAISVAMWRELTARFQELSNAEDVRCILIRGEGGNFAAGADIEEFPRERADLESIYRYHQEILAPALHAIGDCPHPVVAVIEGVCVGGGLEIASQCDLRLAADTARFGAPINRLGFPMAPEEFRGLLAVAGRAVTLELLLEGRILSAPEALAKGLLTRILPPDALEAAVQKCVENLLRGAPLAARHNKAMLRRLSPEPAPFTREELLAFYGAWCDSPEHREGVAAFLKKAERRKAH